MIWRDDELLSPEDYVAALTRIARGGVGDHEIEPRLFREAYEAAGHPNFEGNIGYLTGYMDPDHGATIRRIFKVKHPIAGDLIDKPMPDSYKFVLGMEFQKGLVDGLDEDVAAKKAQDAVRALMAVHGQSA